MIYSKSVADLLGACGIPFSDQCDPQLIVADLCSDSRMVSSGSLFCAYPGLSSDGRDYLEQAKAQGAVVALCEEQGFEHGTVSGLPTILVSNLQQKLGELAHSFFDQPSDEMQVFGITGTNGKTTCCYLLTQAFELLGLEARMIGTIGSGAINQLNKATHTTPDAISLHRQLAEFRQQGATQVCMEVSSHALVQGRVNGVRFFSTLFTNLSHDHLDFHGTMESYGEAKRRLFTQFSSELTITNAECELGSSLVEGANSEFVASYGQGGDVAADEIVLGVGGIEMLIETSELEFLVKTPLVGKVNVPNVLLVVSTLLALSTPVEDVQRILSQFKAAPGRMDLYRNNASASVVVDFAHTPDALEKALLSVREHCLGQLWCVFGCGGDRDKNKRPEMGAIAVQLSDQIIVTNDNPRTEAADQIAAEIVAGIVNVDPDAEFTVVLDRAQAIKVAIDGAAPEDWVVVAGKGHETTQTIGKQVLEFSDRSYVAQLLEVAA